MPAPRAVRKAGLHPHTPSDAANCLAMPATTALAARWRKVASGRVRVIVRYGFAPSPDVPHALAPLVAADPRHNHVTTGYFINRQTI